MNRVCLACGKSIEGYHFNSKYCSKKCSYSTKREPDKVMRARELRFNRQYGITVDEYKKKLEEQKHRCAICGTDDPKQNSAGDWFPVDHDHKTGKFRGLLCSRCNRGIGLFLEDTKLLQSAIDYLNKCT